MYHEVHADDAPSDGGGYFAVGASQFARQLDTLLSLGLRGSSLESVAGQPPNGRVAITFDDGHWTHAAHALPLLRDRDMTATFFIITSRVGSPGYCSWDELRGMRDAGMSLQSHTHSHPFLSQLDSSEVRLELTRSREELDHQLGQRTTTLALPGGDSPRGWSAADYQSAGYRWIATSRWGLARDDESPFIRRYTVRRATPEDTIRRMVAGLVPDYSAEGLRLTALHGVRSLLGASRYARWRRRVLSALRR
jgi:peptidoglycan/xylan/chitin deacetylase (PgdA/CDA1 family)